MAIATAIAIADSVICRPSHGPSQGSGHRNASLTSLATSRRGLSFAVIGVLASLASAWSPRSGLRLRVPSRPAHHGGHRAITKAWAASSPEPSPSSAYDPSLPPALVGEAVRSALRSDRGVCFDFGADRYTAAPDDGGAAGTGLVSVTALRGPGARSFVDAKFSGSVPRGGATGGGGAAAPARLGHAFEAAYLTAKGRIVDRVLVVAFPPDDGDDEDAFLITSPGNGGTALHDELAPFVFPMDEVALAPADMRETSVLTLACASLQDADASFRNNAASLLAGGGAEEFELPAAGACHHHRVAGGAGTKADAYLLRHTFLPEEACHGYTLLLREKSAEGGPGAAAAPAPLAARIWRHLTAADNAAGPVGLGAQEYDTLRVEAGLPGYGREMTGDGPKHAEGDGSAEPYCAKAGPLELHLDGLLDLEKGCYRGAEGVASVLKNRRGPPRQLYQAVFREADNAFDAGAGEDGGPLGAGEEERRAFRRKLAASVAEALPNRTRRPRSGDDVYVLGSDEARRIHVGKITSVAQPNGTGKAETIALVLVRRPTPILNAIEEQGLEKPRWWDNADDDDDEGGAGQGITVEDGSSGIMAPPPLDPLHNLEIVVADSYTIGRLVSVPSRQGRSVKPDSGNVVETRPAEQGKLETAESVARLDPSLLLDTEERSEAKELARAKDEAVDAAVTAAAAAAAEAQRKEDKMNMLKARAEAAMAARRKAKEAKSREEAAAAAAAEAQRKEDKMKMLKARAEAAIAARRQKKSSG